MWHQVIIPYLEQSYCIVLHSSTIPCRLISVLLEHLLACWSDHPIWAYAVGPVLQGILCYISWLYPTGRSVITSASCHVTSVALSPSPAWWWSYGLPDETYFVKVRQSSCIHNACPLSICSALSFLQEMVTEVNCSFWWQYRPAKWCNSEFVKVRQSSCISTDHLFSSLKFFFAGNDLEVNRNFW